MKMIEDLKTVHAKIVSAAEEADLSLERIRQIHLEMMVKYYVQKEVREQLEERERARRPWWKFW